MIYDLNFLATLPYDEILSGYAEVYKHALLTGQVAVDDIENTSPQRKLQSLNDMISLSSKELKLN